MTEQPDWMTPDPWEVELDRKRTPQERAEHRRAYLMNYRRGRRDAAPIVGWLHELKCDGNHRGYSGCTPIACYSDAP